MQSLFEAIPQNVHILVYADDISLMTFHHYKSLARERMQSAINFVVHWADNRGFTIAPERSQLHISLNRQGISKLPDLNIKRIKLPAKKNLKILGVYIDSRLNFKAHADAIRDSTINRLQIIKARMPCAHRSTILRIINAWLLPKIFYAVGPFSRGGETVIKKLRPLYNQAFRLASGVFVTSPIVAVMAECGQLPFEYYLLTCLVTKAIRWLSLTGRNEVPLVLRTNHIMESTTNLVLPSIAMVSRAKNRPRNQLSPSADLTLLYKVKAGDHPSDVQQHFYQLLSEKYQNYHHSFIALKHLH